MGHGIDRIVCFDIISSILKTRLPSIESISISSSVMDCILKKYLDVVQLIHGNTIDRTHIYQASEEGSDSDFYKLEKCIELLQKTGKIIWRNYKEIPKRHLYNTTKAVTKKYYNMWKIIGTSSILGHIFNITYWYRWTYAIPHNFYDSIMHRWNIKSIN